ncbi:MULTISPECIES: hypothetical protein [unclassified Bacillus (in: firmicutes)]|uniref:hypothetical protein n=1 Tax=unclassified Bacillus (in: firmicutes) TaxID=185979 RepID=UPI00300FE788
MSFLTKLIIIYIIVVILSVIIAMIEAEVTKSPAPVTLLISICIIVMGPLSIPMMNKAHNLELVEEKVARIFGDDIKKENISDDKLIVYSKEGTFEITYNDNTNIKLIKSITGSQSKEKEQREKTKELLKNI